MSSKPHVRMTMSSPHHARNRSIASANGTPRSRRTLSRMPVSFATLLFIFLKYFGRIST